MLRNQVRTLLERKEEFPDRAFTIDVMKDAGIDVRSNTATQLNKDMLNKYDLVINMAAKHHTPTWLSEAPNYIYWKITDPKGRSG